MLSDNLAELAKDAHSKEIYSAMTRVLLVGFLFLIVHLVWVIIRRLFARHEQAAVGWVVTRILATPTGATLDHVATTIARTAGATEARLTQFESIVRALNTKLLKVVAAKIVEAAAAPKPKLLDATIIGLLVGRRAKQNTIAYLSLIVAFLAYVTICLTSNKDLSLIFLSFLASLLIAVYTNQRVLRYRILHGFYGANEYEAREIIRFILSESDKSNFTDSQGRKALLPTLPVDSESERAADLGEEGVRT